MTYEELMDDLRGIDRLAWAAGIALEDVDRPVVVAARKVASLFSDGREADLPWGALEPVAETVSGMLARHFFGRG